jgi:hypothetical protein
MINLTARKVVATVGGLDVSAALVSLTVQNSHLDQSGLIKATGTLTLAPVRQLTESLDPRVNRTRWAKGQAIAVWITDTNGTLKPHPRGALRILKVPTAPSRTNRNLEIEVGCQLSLLDYRQPPGDQSGVVLGSATDRTAIINALAGKAGCGELLEAIAAWPLNYPLARLSGGFISQMGLLAYAAGYGLWIDHQERLRAKRLDLEALPSFDLVVGRDESVFDPRPADEVPCEKILCTAVVQRVKATEDNPKEIVSVAAAGKYNPSEISSTRFLRVASAIPRMEQFIQQALGIVLPDDFPNQGGLVPAAFNTKVSYYDAGGEGLLRREVEDSQLPLGQTLPDYFPKNTQLVNAKQTVTEYRYAQGATQRISRSTYEQQAVVYPADEGFKRLRPTDLTLSEYEIQEWRRNGRGWTQITRQGNLKNNTSKTTTTRSGSGNNTPPAPERREQPFTTEEQQIEATALFPQFGDLAFDERQRSFEVPTAVNVDQLQFVANQLGRLLHGRSQPVTWGMDIRNAQLDNYEPLAVYEWLDIGLDGEAVKVRYLADGDSFSLTPDQAAYAADGLLLGVVQRYRPDGLPPTPIDQPPQLGEVEAISPPYQVASGLAGTLLLFGEFGVIPYATDSGSTLMRGLLPPLVGEFFREGLLGRLVLLGRLFSPGGRLNLDWIVVADGSVVTSGGNVVSTEGDFGAIVVADGEVVTSNGFVVSTEGDFDAIVVADGEVVTSNGFVVGVG